MDTYVDKLVYTLHKVAIYDRSHTEFRDYTTGMQAMAKVLRAVRERKGCAFFIGNGGSAAIASHMTADFMKNGGMRTCSLMEHSVLTCMGNDYGYENIYAEQLKYLGKEGDVLIAVSSSGNSENILNAVRAARNKKMEVISFTGFRPDNKLLSMGDYQVFVPSEKYGFVETIHNLMLQQLVDELSEGEKSRGEAE